MPKDKPLKVVVDNKQLDADTNKVVGYDPTLHLLSTVYESIKASPRYHIYVGVALLCFGLDYNCNPETFDKTAELPDTIMPEVKGEIVDFHSMPLD